MTISSCQRRRVLVAVLLYLVSLQSTDSASWDSFMQAGPRVGELNAAEFLNYFKSDAGNARNEYEQFVEAMANFEEKFSAFESDWRRMRNNFLIYYLQQRSRPGSTGIRWPTKDDNSNGQLRTQLATALQSYDAVAIARGTAPLLNISEVELAEEVYSAAINRALRHKAANVVARNIQLVHREGNLKSLELTAQMQLYLYWKMASRPSENGDYLLRAAHSFSKIKANKDYQKLSPRLRTVFEFAVKQLPETLRFVFFEPTYCLFNVGRKEYMYTAEGIYAYPQVRFTFTWIPSKGEMSQGAWITKFLESSSDDGALTATLKCKLYDNYMFLEYNVAGLNNLVAAWAKDLLPHNNIWTLNFVDNALVISQSSLLMCTSGRRYDGDRRYVLGFNDTDHSASNKECQWIATTCPDGNFEVIRD